MTKFKFFIQKIHGEPSDAILFDRVDGYSTTAIIKSKIQVGLNFLSWPLEKYANINRNLCVIIKGFCTEIFRFHFGH